MPKEYAEESLPGGAITSGRVETQPEFRWDACGAYLFDIDGTLLHAGGGVHMDALASGIFEVTGHRLSFDKVVVRGNTDTGILRDAFRQAAIADDAWLPRQEEILARTRATVWERQRFMQISVYPGVVAMLRYLSGKGCALGVATGNLEQIGWLKIELAGLRQWFSFGGFSDRHPLRSEMIRHAAERARQIAGGSATVCVVGDTPSDIAAAKSNSLPTIAVATGVYSFEELRKHSPEACASTLEALLVHAPAGG